MTMASLMVVGGLELKRVIIHSIEENTFLAILKLRDDNGDEHDLIAVPAMRLPWPCAPAAVSGCWRRW